MVLGFPFLLCPFYVYTNPDQPALPTPTVPAYKVIELGDQSGLRVGAKREQKPFARSEGEVLAFLDHCRHGIPTNPANPTSQPTPSKHHHSLLFSCPTRYTPAL